MGRSESVGSSSWGGVTPAGLSPSGSVLHMHHQVDGKKGSPAIADLQVVRAGPAVRYHHQRHSDSGGTQRRRSHDSSSWADAVATSSLHSLHRGSSQAHADPSLEFLEEDAGLHAAHSEALHAGDPPLQLPSMQQARVICNTDSSTAGTPALAVLSQLDCESENPAATAVGGTAAALSGPFDRLDRGRHQFAAAAAASSLRLSLRRSRSSDGLTGAPPADHEAWTADQSKYHSTPYTSSSGNAGASSVTASSVAWGDEPITLVVQVEGNHLQYTRHVSARISGGPELTTSILRIFYAQPVDAGEGPGAGHQGQLHPLSLLQSGLNQVCVGPDQD